MFNFLKNIYIFFFLLWKVILDRKSHNTLWLPSIVSKFLSRCANTQTHKPIEIGNVIHKPIEIIIIVSYSLINLMKLGEIWFKFKLIFIVNNNNKWIRHKFYNSEMSTPWELGLWCLTSLSTLFQLYREGQKKPEHLEKTTDLPQVWQTWSHNVISSTACHERDSNSQH